MLAQVVSGMGPTTDSICRPVVVARCLTCGSLASKKGLRRQQPETAEIADTSRAPKPARKLSDLHRRRLSARRSAMVRSVRELVGPGVGGVGSQHFQAPRRTSPIIGAIAGWLAGQS